MWLATQDGLASTASGLATTFPWRSRSSAERVLTKFDTGYLMFARIGKRYEQALDEAAQSLCVRYAMNLRPATERYGAIGRPQDVAANFRAFYDAGVRHISLDLVGPYETARRTARAFRRRGAAPVEGHREMSKNERSTLDVRSLRAQALARWFWCPRGEVRRHARGTLLVTNSTIP